MWAKKGKMIGLVINLGYSNKYIKCGDIIIIAHFAKNYALKINKIMIENDTTNIVFCDKATQIKVFFDEYEEAYYDKGHPIFCINYSC